MAFQPKIRKARFKVDGISPQVMIDRIGNPVAASIKARIQRAEDVNDNPAPPLKTRQTVRQSTVFKAGKNLVGISSFSYSLDRGYPRRKQLKGLSATRDWSFTGRTLRAMRVTAAGVNTCTIGFSDSEAAKRAAINNQRWRQFGLSPKNRKDLMAALAGIRVVRVERAA